MSQTGETIKKLNVSNQKYNQEINTLLTELRSLPDTSSNINRKKVIRQRINMRRDQIKKNIDQIKSLINLQKNIENTKRINNNINNPRLNDQTPNNAVLNNQTPNNDEELYREFNELPSALSNSSTPPLEEDLFREFDELPSNTSVSPSAPPLEEDLFREFEELPSEPPLGPKLGPERPPLSPSGPPLSPPLSQQLNPTLGYERPPKNQLTKKNTTKKNNKPQEIEMTELNKKTPKENIIPKNITRKKIPDNSGFSETLIRKNKEISPKKINLELCPFISNIGSLLNEKYFIPSQFPNLTKIKPLIDNKKKSLKKGEIKGGRTKSSKIIKNKFKISRKKFK